MTFRTGVPLSSLLLAVFVIIGLAATLMIRTTLEDRQKAVVSQMGKEESRRTAEQIYQHLYSVMRKGWSREELNETIQRIASVYPDIRIDLVRGAGVAVQYGDDEASVLARQSDPAIAAALASGRTSLTETDRVLRYIMPMPNHAECAACHDSPAGDINGLIDIRIPPEKLRAPIQATLSPLPNLISLLIGGIFVAVFLLLRYQIVRPVVRLSQHATDTAQDIDRASAIEIKRIWPREIRILAERYNQMVREIQDNHRHLVEMAARDKLTGLYNRRYFDEMLARTLDQAERSKQPVALLMLDLDRFKPINDKFGHAVGDKVLAEVGKAIQKLTRDGDICARVGGDEFLIIAVNCDQTQAERLANRLRDSIQALSFLVGGETVAVGTSLGVANYPNHARTLDELLTYADQAMYRNKRANKEAMAA